MVKKLPFYFYSEDREYRLTKKADVREWLQQAVIDHEREMREVNYIFCSDHYLHRINKRFLRHDDYTDIITFDYAEDERLRADVYISIDRARENASTFDVAVPDEIHRLLIHGLLHLLGYTDKTDEDKSIMSAKEDYYLSLRKF